MLQFEPPSTLYSQLSISLARVTFTVASFVILSEPDEPVSDASAKLALLIGAIVSTDTMTLVDRLIFPAISIWRAENS